TWNNVHKFRVSHRVHHQVTVFTGRDLEVVLPERFRPIDWFYMFTINPISGAGGVPGILSMIWETVRYAFGSFNKEWENILFPVKAGKARRQIFNFSRATLIFHIVTATWFIISGNWILILIINIGAYIAPWLAILSALPQHLGLCGNVPDWRMNCRTMILNPVVQFFYWNMNYHIEHHMYASVPFHRMKALHEEIKHDCPEPSKGLIKTWRSLIPVIRKQRIDPEFCIKPELPA
ncbi:MAG: fatty acid desaturase, partial [Spirochaetaceae bacterium]|nr:fatty acid desaturase [Spirochaetaceae bacterium]